jgi:hypothetical protein
MLFKLICLHKDGVPIEKEKLAEVPTYIGNLAIEDWVEGSVFKRPVRYARLLTSDHLIPADMIPPLFEPTIIRMTSNQMTLNGYQIGTRDGAAVHYMQSRVARMTRQKT